MCYSLVTFHAKVRSGQGVVMYIRPGSLKIRVNIILILCASVFPLGS
jgi:hypothetical protein